MAVLAAPATAETRSAPVILALGDSLTAGYGLAPEKSFPSQLEAALARNGIVVQVVNGGVSGDTSAGGLARLDWLLADRPDVVIVELGANDGLRGLEPDVTHRNLDGIVTRIRAAGADVVLAGMRAPPNLGSEYGTAFAALYTDLAEKHGVAYYPFFLEGVAANPALNQEDGIHPTAEGIAVIVENILPVVTSALVEAGR
ncbi:MAG: arylesterase [Alphaproteobacteria bacterium]|nr:arylesterase [Alphaproteobacteria bacterium]